MKWLINPFERIAGWTALMIGVVVMALTAVVGTINHVAFDGVLDIHSWAKPSFSESFAMQVIDFFALFLTKWLAGACFSRSKLRAVDVAGTMALARVPMLLLAIVCFLPVVPESLYDFPRMIIFSLICMPFWIWMIVLKYNAWVVSCHMKGNRAVVSFIGSLLVAEIISKVVIIFLLGSMLTNIPIKDVFSSGSKENVVVIVDSLTIRQKTENVVKAFEQGDFNAITFYFDETMKKAISSSGLKIAWLQVNMQCGKFEKANLDELKEASIEKYDIVEVPFYFQKEKQKLRLAFNSDGKISGLFFLPMN